MLKLITQILNIKVSKIKYFKNLVTLTDVAKLVDALDLGPSDFCFESSSLSIRNFIKKQVTL